MVWYGMVWITSFSMQMKNKYIQKITVLASSLV